jgi:adenylate cyclase class 2
MAQEIEAKFYILQVAELRHRIEALGASLTEHRVRELNLRFDTPDRDLHQLGHVLRLRQDTRARLTYKDSSRMDAGVLSRGELEITVSDFNVTRDILEALGYQVAFIYEKYRTTYRLGAAELMLDEMPYGNFLEIEGDPDAIRPAAERLQLNWATSIPESYSSLFDKLSRRGTVGFRDLTFDNFRGVSISAEDLGVTPADGNESGQS